MKKVDKCSSAGTTVDNEPQPIDFRQPAYCQTPCYAPFSGSPSSELYNMDCVEGMKHYPDKYFDLAIVDPTYGIGMDGGNVGYKGFNDFEKKNWDLSIPEKLYFIELFRVSKNQIIWGGNYFIPHLPQTRCFLVWDKGEGFYNRTYAECELAWTSFNRNTVKVKRDPLANGDYKGKIHLCQKPLFVYEYILNDFAEAGQRILDTHVGSGSSRIACYLNGFDFVGFEIDEDYCQSSEKRFRNAIKQQRLF
jgi:site-specific DNA-methyltransferase (adenine-specific)